MTEATSLNEAPEAVQTSAPAFQATQVFRAPESRDEKASQVTSAPESAPNEDDGEKQAKICVTRPLTGPVSRVDAHDRRCPTALRHLVSQVQAAQQSTARASSFARGREKVGGKAESREMAAGACSKDAVAALRVLTRLIDDDSRSFPGSNPNSEQLSFNEQVRARQRTKDTVLTTDFLSRVQDASCLRLCSKILVRRGKRSEIHIM